MENSVALSLVKDQGFINGEWIHSEHQFPVYNPADGSLLVRVANLTPEHVHSAIAAADLCLTSRWAYDTNFRIDKLNHLLSTIEAHLRDLVIIETLEQGKPIEQAEQEWRSALLFIDNVIQQARQIDEVHSITTNSPALSHRVIKEPIGVVAAITPWNFPVASVINKCCAAMAAGCAVVLKPSELTPLSALAFCHLASSVDIPPGVLNVIPTLQPDAVGEVLMQDARVRLLTFTGSTAVGKRLAAAATHTVKRVELEMGGNAPFILLPDGASDSENDQLLEAAADALIGARFYNSGQICIGANRVYVEASTLTHFLDKLIPKVQQLQVGPGMNRDSDCGPLINEEALEKIERLIADAVNKGAKIVLGGARLKQKGHYFQPTILTQITDDMAIHHTEIFGPVVAIQTFTDQEQVLTAANNTAAGLAAYLFCTNRETQLRFTRRLQAGMVGCNTTHIIDPQLAFGGIKESGYGREGGAHALEPFLIEKSVSLAVL